ncbi:zinc finger protein-like 1 homolog [Galendromus occidentalis]|uniref:Zinc finger protein-like 1 homolog n=1 Tax=Galendromus occidentalis TaxID=34638 RepID=A0AAJ6QNY8_9ACAR|nr:zinc finger protein-like 1 homolog [Galendromus occidentalis]
MGLCRCPKRKVTTQFCYEHRVNVCEHCMVEDHPNCIVQGYLQWLKDSDYEPVCTLCRKELVHAECVRLLCYHVFHWPCLDEHLQQLPSTTAPAGFTCPTCGHEVIPRDNVASPVAAVIREKLRRAQWAAADRGRDGNFQQTGSLGRSLSSMASSWSAPNPMLNDSSVSFADDSSNNTMSRNSSVKQYTASNVYGETSSARSFVSQPLLRTDEEDKYKRKSVVELAHRWFQSKMLLGTRRRDPTRRWAAITIGILIFFFVVVYAMSRIGRSSSEVNPFLDPESNPNLNMQ